MPPNELQTVPLFESGHGGYGDGRNVSRKHRYNRVLRGFDNRKPGEAAFSHFISKVPYTSATNNELDFAPLAAIEWRDINGLDPCVFIIDANWPTDGGRIWKMKNGAITRANTNIDGTSGTDLKATTIITDAVLHEGDSGSGVFRPFIYLAMGQAADLQRFTIDQVIDTSVTGDIERDKLASINGRLYGSADTQGVSQGDLHVWAGITNVPPGLDPMQEANWAPVVNVGFPSTDIMAIVRVQSVACVIKPEGIFVASRDTGLWENRMPAWERYPHADNGRGAFTLGAAAVIPVARGGAVIFDGYSIRDFSPFDKLATPNLDTTQQSISCMGMSPTGLLAVTTVNRGVAEGTGSRYRHAQVNTQMVNSKLTRGGGGDDSGSDVLGVRVLKSVDNGANFTDYTTEANDGKLLTVVDMSSLSTLAAGDFVIVGHPRPFQATMWYGRGGDTTYNVNTSVMSAHIWNGTSWVAITIQDFTARDWGSGGDGQAAHGKSGLVVFTQDPVVLGWQADTVDSIFSVTEDTQSNFWVRYTFSAALDSSVTRTAVELLPYRPSIDPTNFPEDALDRAGCYPHLLWGEPAEEGTAVWHDLGAIMTAITDVDEIGALLYAEVGGAKGNSTNKLCAFGRRNVYMLEDFDPTNYGWPFVSPSGLEEWGAIRPGGGQVASLREVRLEFREADALTNMFFYYRYNENERWSKQTFGVRGTHATVNIRDDRGGVDFSWALGYLMSEDTVARQPKMVHCEADFEILPIEPDRLSQRPIPQIPRG